MLWKYLGVNAYILQFISLSKENNKYNEPSDMMIWQISKLQVEIHHKSGIGIIPFTEKNSTT